MVDKKVHVIGKNILKMYFDSYTKIRKLVGKNKTPKIFQVENKCNTVAIDDVLICSVITNI